MLMSKIYFELKSGGIVLFKQVQKDEKDSLTLFSLIFEIICEMVMFMVYMIWYAFGCFKSGFMGWMPLIKRRGNGILV